MQPPSDAAVAAIAETRREIFGVVQGNGERSGRKVLRERLKGPHVASWYPLGVHELGLQKLGVDDPVREQLYRKEQQDNRVGKTRMKGKLRPPTVAFVEQMKLIDAEDGIIDQADYFYPEDALPDEQVVAKLQEGLDNEGRAVLGEIFSEVAVMAEAGRMEKAEAAAGGDAASEKASRARDKAKLRRSLADKRMKDDDATADARSGGDKSAGDAAGGGSGAAQWFTMEEVAEMRAAAKAAGVELDDDAAAPAATAAESAVGASQDAPAVLATEPAAAAAHDSAPAQANAAADASSTTAKSSEAASKKS